ncbi:MAG: SDR family NAD(P)-dependent oxidoreductase [Porticoccaceae bacterium]
MSEFSDGCSVLFGASGGLGQAIAERMAELGAEQVITYRSNPQQLEGLVARLNAQGRTPQLESCDVTDADSVAAVIDKAIARHGRVHTVINATGLQYAFGTLAEQDPQAFANVLDVDVKGFFNIARAAVPHMRAAGGAIVTLGTAAVDATTPGNTLSSVPKSAVAMMIRLLAAEEGRHGIRANFVGVGVYSAGMALRMEEAGATARATLEDFARERVPLRRTGQAHECADVVAFLASNRASYVTGQILHVDGGLSV